MAKLNVQGFGELEADLKALLDMPDSIADDILNAEADVVIAAQRKESSQLWNGPYHTGITPKSIKKDKIKDKGGKKRSIMVSPQGTTAKVSETLRSHLSTNTANAASRQDPQCAWPTRRLIRTSPQRLKRWSTTIWTSTTCEVRTPDVPAHSRPQQ